MHRHPGPGQLHAHTIIDGSRRLAVLSIERALPPPRPVNLRVASLRAAAAHGQTGELRWQRRKHQRPSSRLRAARPVARVLVARRAVWHCSGQVCTDIGRVLFTVSPRAKPTDHASPPPLRARHHPPSCHTSVPTTRSAGHDSPPTATLTTGFVRCRRSPKPANKRSMWPTPARESFSGSQAFRAVAVLEMRPEVLRDVSLHQHYDSIVVVM